jgi:hypothetical protein
MVVTVKLLRNHRLLLLLLLTHRLGVDQVFRADKNASVSYIAHILAACIDFVWGDKRV